MTYSPRIILFVDILGFSSDVDKAFDSEEVFNKLKGTLEYVHNLFSVDSIPGSDVEILQYSDSLVISMKVDSPGGASYMIRNASFAMHAFFTNGYICKGVIHIGYIYHKQGVLFGPGYIESMKFEALEDRPIIKFKKVLLEVAKNFPSDGQSGNGDLEIEYLKEHYELLKGEDYKIAWFQDYASLASSSNENTIAHYTSIKSLIENNILAAKSIRVLKKYLHLKIEFNNASYLKHQFPNGILVNKSNGFYVKRMPKHYFFDLPKSLMVKAYWRFKI